MPFLDEDGVTRLTEDYLDIFAPKEELGEGDGTNAGPIYELTAKGHAEQFSTTGKNLFNIGDPSLNSLQGFSFSHNNQTAYVSGTGTVNVGTPYNEQSYIVLPAGTYTASINTAGTGNIDAVYLRINKDRSYGESITGITQGVYNGSITFSLTAETSLYISFGVKGSDTYGSFPTLNARVTIQLEAGSTATAYEPYTGGAPSPSPNYPQEIQVVRGRNLIDESKSTVGYKLDTSGALVSSSTFDTTDYIPVTDGETYYATNVAGNSIALTAAFYNSSKSFLVFADAVTGYNIEYGIEVPSGAAYVRLTYLNETSNRYAGPPQFTLGSAPQSYVPYGHVGMEAHGKNLLDESKSIAGKVVGSGDVYNSTWSMATDYIEVEGGTDYYLQNAIGETSAAAVAWYNSSKVFLSTSPFPGEVRSGVVSSPANAKYLRFSYRMDASGTDTVQLTRGSEPLPYEPYYHSTTPIPLPDRGWVGGLPDGTSDILTLDGAGKCEWTLADEEYTIVGNEPDVFDTEQLANGIYRVGMKNVLQRLAPDPNTIVNSRVGFCSHSPYAVSWSYAARHAYVGVNRIWIYEIASNAQQVLDAFTGATILYPLATPIHESKGYIEDWPTDIPEGATITIPELDALNVKYFVANDSISQYAEQWYERTKAVDISPVEDAVVELAENLVDTADDLETEITDLTTLDPIGGLERVSDGVRIGSLVQESDGYARGGLAQVTAKGHAEQFSTTGKNLIGISGTATNTANGVTFEWNDNHLVVSGTTTSNNTDSQTMTLANSVTLIANTTYMFSFDGTFDVSNGFCAMIFYNGSTGAGNVTESTDGTWTITPTNEITFNRLKFRCSTNGMSINVDARLQLELGSTATTYEPYTGGAPSPSPDYPQEIQVVRGRNLLPALSSSINTNKGVTFTISGDSIIASGTSNANIAESERIAIDSPIVLQAGIAYTLSLNGAYSVNGSTTLMIFYDINGTAKFNSGSSNTGIWTFTPSETVQVGYVRFRVNTSDAVVNINAHFQLTLGSTPQPYVPYGYVGMEVQGKNLLAPNPVINSNVRRNTDDSITIVSLPSSGQSFLVGSMLLVGGQSYVMSGAISNASYMYVSVDGANKSDAGSSVIITPSADQTVYVNCVITQNSVVGTTFYPMIRLASDMDDTYEPYYHTTTPIPLPDRGWVGGLPDGTADELLLDGAGKVEWGLKTWIESLSGKSVYSSSPTQHIFRINGNLFTGISRKPPDNSVLVGVLSNRYIEKAYTPLSASDFGRFGVSVTLLFSIIDPCSSTDAEFLENNADTIFFYSLATPVTEDCGYVDMPDIPSDCTITIPELDALGIRYFVDNSVTEYGKQIYARAYAELGDAIVELTERVVELEQSQQ